MGKEKIVLEVFCVRLDDHVDAHRPSGDLMHLTAFTRPHPRFPPNFSFLFPFPSQLLQGDISFKARGLDMLQLHHRSQHSIS